GQNRLLYLQIYSAQSAFLRPYWHRRTIGQLAADPDFRQRQRIHAYRQLVTIALHTDSSTLTKLKLTLLDTLIGSRYIARPKELPPHEHRSPHPRRPNQYLAGATI